MAERMVARRARRHPGRRTVEADMDNLVPISLFFAMAYGGVAVVRLVTDTYTRRQIIRQGLPPEHAKQLLSARTPTDGDGLVTWGVLLLALAAAFIILQFLPFRENDPFSIGLVLGCGGLGLLAARMLHRRRA